MQLRFNLTMDLTKLKKSINENDFWLATSLAGLAVSLFVSKSGLTAFFLTTLLLCVLTKKYRGLWLKDKTVLMISSLYFFAAAAGLFSEAGFAASWSTIRMWPYALTAIIAAVAYEKKYHLEMKWAFYIGLTIGGIKALTVLASRWDPESLQDIRINSFWDIGRWGTFTSVFCIGLFPHIILKRTYDKMFFLKVFLFLFSFLLLFMSNTRAPLLASLICLGIMTLIHRKGLIAFSMVLLGMGLFTLAYPGYYDRFTSSFNVAKNPDGQYVSKNISNAGRLNMWKVSLDYWQNQPLTPSGFDHYKKPLKKFLAAQDQSYIEKYTLIEFSYNDNHSTYLFFLIQVGLFFSLILWAVVFYILLKNMPKLWKYFDERPLFYSAYFIVIAHLILGLFYSSLVSFEAITFFPALYLIDRINTNRQTNQNVL